jgi:hypothetical protein
MKRITWTVILLYFFCEVSFAQVNTKAVITVTNSSNVNRTEELVAIPWQSLVSKYPTIDTANFIVINSLTKKSIPFQLEHLGEKAIQNLLVQVNIPANSSLKLYVQKGKPASVTPKTFCRFVPERKDDFAWENDKIAFRMYGKALEGTKEDAYGMDVWVKRTTKLILNERYKRGEYHIDHGDGMDYYHVGFSLGAGNSAPYVNDSIWYSNNYHRWRVLDNGPLRSTFQLEYDEWDVAGMPVKLVKTISLDAGSQLSRVEANYQYSNISELPIVVGVIKRKEPGKMLLDEQKGIMAYWEPQHGADGTTGVGVITTVPVVKMKVGNEQLLLQTTIANNKPMVYYTGAAWDKAGLITDSKAWFNYLNSFQQRLEKPLIVRVQ